MEVRKGYKLSEVGEIPVDWAVKEIGKEIDLITGFPFKSNKYSSTGVRLLRGSNVKRGVTDWSEDITQYWEAITPELKPYILAKGDIVIAMDGSLVGRSFARLSSIDIPALLLQRVARIRSTNIELGYLKEFICSDYFTKHCDASKTVTAIPHISPADIRKFKVPVPPTKSEQTAIATALSDADALITSLEKLIEKKRAIKQGAMQELLKPKEGWDVKKLGDLTKLFTKQTGFDYTAYIKPSLIQIKSDDTLPFIQNKDFKNKWVNLNTDYFIPKSIAIKFPQILLDEKSLLISISGSVGNVGVYDSKELAFIGGAVAILKFKEPKLIEWVMIYLISKEGQNNLLGNVKAGSHQNLILEDIRKIEILLPNVDEQASIVNILSDMDDEIVSLELNLAKYKQIKQGMMQELLTGKIRLVK